MHTEQRAQAHAHLNIYNTHTHASPFPHTRVKPFPLFYCFFYNSGSEAHIAESTLQCKQEDLSVTPSSRPGSLVTIRGPGGESHSSRQNPKKSRLLFPTVVVAFTTQLVKYSQFLTLELIHQYFPLWVTLEKAEMPDPNRALKISAMKICLPV